MFGELLCQFHRVLHLVHRAVADNVFLFISCIYILYVIDLCFNIYPCHCSVLKFLQARSIVFHLLANFPVIVLVIYISSASRHVTFGVK
jgi:hypothetical protein